MGDGVDESLLGTPVAVKPSLPCGECAECGAGSLADCCNKRLIGLWSDGCMAEKVAVPQVNLVPCLGMVHGAHHPPAEMR